MCWVLCQALQKPHLPSSPQSARQTGDTGSEQVCHLPRRTPVCLTLRPGTFYHSMLLYSSRLPRTPGPPTRPCWQLGIAAGSEGPCSIALWPKCPFPGQITCTWNSPFGTRHSNRAFSCLFLQKSSAIQTAKLPQRSTLKSIAFSIHNWETFSIN